MKTLKNKCVVITGAGSGIGQALALRCAALGSHLALCDIRAKELEQTQALLRGVPGRVLTAVVNVADRQEVEAFAGTVATSFGAADVLINNAGVSLSQSVAKSPPGQMEELFAVNFWGVTYGCSAFLPQLVTRPEAQIVNLSSLFGLVGVMSQAAYSGSKFAVRGYSECLRLELLSTPVKVCCVHPGGVRTNFIRNGAHYSLQGRKTDNEKIAAAFDRIYRTTADQAAAAIIQAIRKGQPRLLIGMDAHIIDALQRLLPAQAPVLVQRFLTWQRGAKSTPKQSAIPLRAAHTDQRAG